MMKEQHMDTEEKMLYYHIRCIQREYEAAAKPFVDRLVQIESMRQPRRIIPMEQLLKVNPQANVLDSL